MTLSADDPTHPTPLGPTTESLLLRAERLLERSVQQLEQVAAVQQQQRSRLALELERMLAPLQQLNQGLAAVIETMARERQDNRSQRWQGQLQDLLTPLDSAVLLLQEVLIQLELPSEALAPGREVQPGRGGQRLQLQQLLALRQRQVLELQAEVQALRGKLFQGPETGLQPGPVQTEESAMALPTIFGDAGA